jgi:hypothetical protein
MTGRGRMIDVSHTVPVKVKSFGTFPVRAFALV